MCRSSASRAKPPFTLRARNPGPPVVLAGPEWGSTTCALAATRRLGTVSAEVAVVWALVELERNSGFETALPVAEEVRCACGGAACLFVPPGAVGLARHAVPIQVVASWTFAVSRCLVLVDLGTAVAPAVLAGNRHGPPSFFWLGCNNLIDPPLH